MGWGLLSRRNKKVRTAPPPTQSRNPTAQGWARGMQTRTDDQQLLFLLPFGSPPRPQMRKVWPSSFHSGGEEPSPAQRSPCLQGLETLTLQFHFPQPPMFTRFSLSLFWAISLSLSNCRVDINGASASWCSCEHESCYCGLWQLGKNRPGSRPAREGHFVVCPAKRNLFGENYPKPVARGKEGGIFTQGRGRHSGLSLPQLGGRL